MITDTEDTITAIATPPGRGALGMVRISGKGCREILGRVFHAKDGKGIVPFKPLLGKIMLSSGRVIDEAVVIFYEGPRSYTREDLAEITCHGSPLILDLLISEVVSQGARVARPGEFTYRAFLNGRLDLIQAEAVRDLIAADSIFQMELALRQLDGRLSSKLKDLSARLLELIALLEGNIDFSEEQHYNFINREEALQREEEILLDLQHLLGSFERGRFIKEGFAVALVGKPNVGKSSIFNYIVGKDRAIVTPIPGTTRDYIEERLKVGNHLVRLLDTAGIRESGEAVEREGVRRSRLMIDQSDLVLFVVDGSQGMDAGDWELMNALREKEKVVVANKSDLPGFRVVDGALAVSAVTGKGMNELIQEVERRMDLRVRYSEEDCLISSARHRDILTSAKAAVERARQATGAGYSEEYAVMDLHEALRLIGQITGEVTIEDIYSHIFSNFCIGK